MNADKTLLTAQSHGDAAPADRRRPPDRLTPLYKRLPPGPHRLERAEVLRHQRIRMHGAMVEAVAANGYEGTSVRQIIALAGVSRRSFYEHFANKQECLLATFDAIAWSAMRRAGEAYLASDGALERRLRAALAEFALAIANNRKAAQLVIVETRTVGVPGLLRLRRATGRCERMLSESFDGARDASALPLPVVRGIAGGLHAAMSMCVREQGRIAPSELTEEMVGWTLRFQTPRCARMSELIADRAARSMRNGHIGRRAELASAARPDERERLMEGALRLSTVEDIHELSAPQIAEAANTSLDAFFEHFSSKDDCYLAALDMLATELLRVTNDEGLPSADWPRAVRRALGELMRLLAGRPHYARTIAAEAFAAGPEAVRRNERLAMSLATLLTDGAPGEPPGALTVAGVGGAIWNTVRCQLAAGRLQMLPALSDYLAYVVLAPFIGAEAAVEVVSGER
ncbi:MAG TPA: helix-turn-helix domain-containing protein [Solirubrobacteraceae bacterium]|jgi:AcrR family transcriptional regulator|nr:helix-turn-helix domain-containing protein [Solirubrobacteraceae bacterium]